MQRLARRYGRWLLLLLFIVLAGVGGWLFWQAEQRKAVEAVSERFTLSLDKVEAGDTTAAVEELAAIEADDNASYAALAGLSRAGVLATGGDYAAAGEALDAVAARADAPQVLRDAATLNAIRMQFDTIEPADVLRRTAPYLEGDSPWFAVAGELAALAHLKSGAPDEAGALYLRITQDQRAPASLRNRAGQMASSLGVAVPDTEEAPAPAAADAMALPKE